nr:unnamed protein product [Digitaria exilis]
MVMAGAREGEEAGREKGIRLVVEIVVGLAVADASRRSLAPALPLPCRATVAAIYATAAATFVASPPMLRTAAALRRAPLVLRPHVALRCAPLPVLRPHAATLRRRR